jgi:hypothetical protein
VGASILEEHCYCRGVLRLCLWNWATNRLIDRPPGYTRVNTEKQWNDIGRKKPKGCEKSMYLY